MISKQHEVIFFMTTISETLIEKKTLISNQKKELKNLLKSFETTINVGEQEFYLSHYNTTHDLILLSFSSESEKIYYNININLNKKKNTQNNSYFFQEGHYSSDKVVSLSQFLLSSKELLEKQPIDFYMNHLKEFNRLTNSISRTKRKIKELELEKKESELSSEIRTLKLFLSSNRKEIKQDKKDFVNLKDKSKKLTYFYISNGKIEFKTGTLMVQNGDKKLFYFSSRFISKKEAMKILDTQVFLNDKVVENIESVPFYKRKEERNRYSSYQQTWYSVLLSEYLDSAKIVIMKNKINSF